MKKRLQTILAHTGISSRRKVGVIIEAGRVRVNGKVVYEKGCRVDTAADEISVDGRPIRYQKKVYYLANKPKGVVSTVSDPHAEKTVLDLIPDKKTRLYPVGRLDKNTTGLIVLTNDGEFANRMTHPRFEVKKTYEAKVKGKVSNRELARLEKGIELDDGKTAPCRARFLVRNDEETLVKIEIHEGRKHQVRRMFGAIGHTIIDLKRVSFAGVELGGLREGGWRRLEAGEIKKMLGTVSAAGRL